MSDAKKCDRCGAFYEPHYPTNPTTIIKRAPRMRTIDLCPVCQDSIESWLDLKPKEAADGKSTEE